MDPELEVRLYGRHEDGGFETLIAYTAKYFDGNIPIPGDTIVTCPGSVDLVYYRVIDRYFITDGFFDRGWALLVERVEKAPDLAELGRQWVEDTKFFNEFQDEDPNQWKGGWISAAFCNRVSNGSFKSFAGHFGPPDSINQGTATTICESLRSDTASCRDN